MKNYTSEVPPEKSIAMIEKILIKGGARQISKEYTGNGDVVAISFSIANPETGAPVYIRLPADGEGAFAILSGMRKDFKWYTANQKAAVRQQAERTAWRLTWDWVAVQLSLIEMRQADLLQVFLPYIIVGSGGMTFYKSLQASRVGMLGYEPKEEPEVEEVNI